MTTYRIPMHQRGTLVGLEQMLEPLDGGDLAWSIRFINAISKRESGLDMLALEAQVRDTRGGLVVDFAALKELGAAIDQVVECEIVARPAGGLAGWDRESSLMVVADDSTNWYLTLPTELSGKWSHQQLLEFEIVETG